MTSYRRLIRLLLAYPSLGIGAHVSCLWAQSSADTLAIVKATADAVVHEARQGGDHHGPFAIMGASSSFWSRAIAAELRSKHSDLVESPTRHSLKLFIGKVTVFRDSAQATVTLWRCTERSLGLNSWTHDILFRFRRSGETWHYLGRQFVAFSDGHC